MMSSTIRAIVFLVISLYLVVSKCHGEGYEPAPNCAQYICPVYTVDSSNKDFEIRSYKTANWVYTQRTTSYELATTKYFDILTSYYDGKNDHNMKIKKTYPIVVSVKNSTYSLYFYLPVPFAPKPVKAGDVERDELPYHNKNYHNKYAAVRRFDGKISDDVIKAELGALKQSLQMSRYQGAALVADFMVATYNPPADVTDRVNEVILWFD